MSTTLPRHAAPPTEQSSAAAWIAVISLSLVAFVIVTTEFIPVGLLPNITDSLHVSLGVATMQISIAAGSALGGVLIDSTSLRIVFLTGGAVLLASALIALSGAFPRKELS
jgi:predicted MFS family arabinose efflux permease